MYKPVLCEDHLYGLGNPLQLIFSIRFDDDNPGVIAEVYIGSVVIECKLAFIEVPHCILIQKRD